MKKRCFFRIIITIIFAFILCILACDNGTNETNGTTSSNTLTGTVTISGNADMGEYLFANTSNLSGYGTAQFQWKRSDTAAGTNPTIIGPDNGLNGYNIIKEDVGKYISVTVTRIDYPGSITSKAIGPISEFSLEFAKALCTAIDWPAPGSQVIYDIVHPLSMPINYKSASEPNVPGSISGTFRVFNVNIVENITGSWISFYGPTHTEYDYSFNNYSNIPQLKIVSGSGSFLRNGYYNDSKRYYYDYVTAYDELSCNVNFVNSGVTYNGVVSLKYYYQVGANSYGGFSWSDQSVNTIVKFGNGSEFKW